jgi:group I intron endonuclease
MNTGSGIYKLICCDYFYIGSAINFKSRLQSHLRALVNGTHGNAHLQAVYNNCQTISMEILEIVDRNNLLEREDEYLSRFYGKDRCVNLAASATAPMLGKEPWNKGKKGVIHTDESKKKISENNAKYWKGKKREDLAEKFKGHEVTEETRKKISSKLKGRNLSEKTKQKMKGRIPWNKGKKGVQVAWNKGLTTTTDERVAKNIENKTKSHQLNKEKGLYEDNNETNS